eukprot:591598-Rhodomonas_salina.2
MSAPQNTCAHGVTTRPRTHWVMPERPHLMVRLPVGIPRPGTSRCLSKRSSVGTSTRGYMPGTPRNQRQETTWSVQLAPAADPDNASTIAASAVHRTHRAHETTQKGSKLPRPTSLENIHKCLHCESKHNLWHNLLEECDFVWLTERCARERSFAGGQLDLDEGGGAEEGAEGVGFEGGERRERDATRK